MGIVKLQPDKLPAINDDTLPQAIKEAPDSIFTSLVPESRISSLLKYVEGYPWTVNFYGQILNKNNTLENFDPSVPNLNQPYYEINGLILQVSSPLSSSYDQATGITTIVGSAVVPYQVTPNVGDVFISNIDTGEDAVFMVTSVSRKTFRKDTIYEVSYSLLFYTSTRPEFIVSLKARINDIYYFNKDTDFFNRDVLITPSVHEAKLRLNRYINESKEYYFSTFAQKEVGTIVIPGLPFKIYDPLLLNFISKIVSYKDLVDIPFFRHNYGDNRYINQKSIFDMLQLKNIDYANVINKQFRFIPTSALPNRTRFGTVFHTGADYILFPKDPNTSTDISPVVTDIDQQSYIANIKTPTNYFLPNITIQTLNNNNVYTKALLHELFVQDWYVVSSNFYNYIRDNTQYNTISYIELLIYKSIKKEAIAREDLVIAIERYTEFSLLHQLYLLPVLWFISLPYMEN